MITLKAICTAVAVWVIIFAISYAVTPDDLLWVDFTLATAGTAFILYWNGKKKA